MLGAAAALLMLPATAQAVFDFVRDAVLLRNLHDFPEGDRPRLVEWGTACLREAGGGIRGTGFTLLMFRTTGE